MGFDVLDSLDREGLLDYVRLSLWQMRLADAFWFIQVEREHGLAAAEELNEKVWAKVGELVARDLVARFGPFEPDLAGFVRAQRLFPWSLLVDYEIEESPGEVIFSVPVCPAQEGRRRHGKGEYVCKHMHRAEFEAFARVVNPAVRVQCLFAPPDPHPADCHCRWRFTLG